MTNTREETFPMASDEDVEDVVRRIAGAKGPAFSLSDRQLIGSLVARIFADRIVVNAYRNGDPDIHQQEAMGAVLAIIDTARSLRPPKGTSVDEALDRFAMIAEISVRQQYGEAWDQFVAHCHGQAELAPKSN